MNSCVAVIGIGEIGGILAKGFLRNGHPVYPLIRQMDLKEEISILPEFSLVNVAVGENDLSEVLEIIPEIWKNRLLLLQNELLPRDWKAAGITDPTVLVVWFEKKPGQDYKVLIPSPVYGPNAGLVSSALEALSIPCPELQSSEELLYELVRKNVYILTTNIAGLITGGTVFDLKKDHYKFALKIAEDVMDIQDHLTGFRHDRAKLIAGMEEAFEADPEHKCMGRSAPFRLKRALKFAESAGIPAGALRKVAAEKL